MTQRSRLLANLMGLVLALTLSTVSFAQCEVNAGSNISICAGESVTLGGNPTIVASGNNPQLTWTNGAGTAANPSVSPAATTTYTVTLVSDGGCSTTDQITVTVFQPPTAAFTFNPSGACASNAVQFTNTSVGAGLEYAWNFGNPQSGANNTSTSNNPSHQFVAPGNGNQSFTVTLTVTDANGCTATTTQSVPVLQAPDPALSDSDIFTPFVMCGNAGQAAFDLTINNTSSTQATNTNYQINWGDGSPVVSSPTFTNLVHTYSGTGFFDLTLTVTGANGCVNTEVYEVFAGSNPSVGLASPGSTINLCAPNTLDFPITNWQNNSLGTTYTVTFSDGTPPQTFVHPPPASISHVFEESSCGSTSIGGFANSYYVRIIAENPCGFSAATIEPIQTSSAPTAAMAVSPGLEGCSNAPFTFTNVSTNANFNNNGNCVSLMTANWSIDPPTGWTVTSGSLNDPTSFSASFQPGTYTVTMVGTNPCGSDVVSVEICATPPPIAQFTIDPVSGCAPLVVPATNLSSSLNNCDNETYLWQVFPNSGWNFASGNASSVNPTFNFSQAGNYTVQLTVTNVCGSDVYTQNVTVYEPPTVNLANIADACEGVVVSPSATYTTGGTPITNYNWSFPGGSPTTSNQANPGAVSYPNNGNYTVSITATNLCGSVTDTEVFIVESAPVVSVSPSNPEICAGSPVALQASGAVTYSWNPSPSLNTTSGANVTATPGSTTTYTVTGTSAAGCTATANATVDVNPNPILTAGGPYVICAGECINIGVTASGGQPPYSNYQWTPAIGLSATNTASVQACLNSSQTYTVTVTDANGCSGQTTVTVTVNPLPVVNAGNDLTLCDQPVPEQLTGFTPAGGQWTGQFVTTGGAFTPNGTGSFTLTYTFVNANGCENSDAVVVTVIDPVAVDAGNDQSFCSGIGAQQLTPLTPGGTWSGTGVTANGLFTPTNPGVYTLTYSVGGGSCLTSDSIEVEVFALPIANAGNDVSICAGDDVQLNGSVNGGAMPYTQVIWSSSPALSDVTLLNPTASPALTSTFTLNITDANGCIASDNVVVTVLTTPVVNAGLDLTLCNQPIPEQLVGFTPNDGSGVWTGDNVTGGGIFTPAGEGSFTLTYTYTNAAGCFASDDLVVTVVDPTTASAGNDFAICVGTPAVNLALGGTWTGTSVTPQGVFTPANTGVFDLTFTIGTGTCQTSDDLQITVLELPVIDAGSDVFICEDDVVQLNVTAQSSNGANFTYLWSGVQLSDATLANPTATPPSTGTFSVLVTDEAGCQANDQMVVNVNTLPLVNAGADLTLCDQAIEEVLTGFSPLPNANSTGEWTGTGIVDPAGVFLSPGTGSYTLTYTFTDIAGCVNTDQLTVTVIEPVVAEAGPPQSICLNNGAYELQNFMPINNITWSGTGISNSNGTFDPLVSGVGDFTLTLEFGAGTCFTTDQVTVTVLPLPVMSVTDNPVFCGNQGISDLGDFSPIGGWWEGTGIADANLGTFDPSIGQGNYPVFYWYTDLGTGCSDTLDVTVSVSPVPEANFNLAAQGCTNAPVDVTNTSVGANFYFWNWGNGATASNANPSYTYPDEGIYTVELTVENNFGCTEVSTASHEIIHPPQAQITLNTNEGCAPLSVEFTNLSEGQYLSYAWDLDVATSTDVSPAPVVYQQGDDVVTYNVSLIATNYCGSSQVDEVITVYPQPIASFGTDYDAFCSPWATQFNNTSVGNPDEWLWDFGDGTSSTLEQPISHTYFTGEEPTDYTITLTTTNECGTDSFSYTITVLPNTVTAFFNTNVTEGCAPLTVEFTDFSTGGTVIAYDFGDDNVSSLDDPIHTFNEPGIYTIYQFVNNGCSFDTTLAFVEVFPAPIADFTTDVLNACAGDPVQFINESSDVNNVAWYFGDGNTSAVTNPQHTYMAGGVYNVTIEVSSAGNECTATITQPFTVYLAPNVNFTVPNQVGCSPFTVNFQNTTTGGSFYAWDFGNGESANSVNPSQTFLNNSAVPELYTVTLTATSLQLCEASTSFDIIVSPTPVSAFTLAQTESCFFPVDVQTTNESLNANGYAWDFGGFGTSQLLNPSFSVDAVGDWPISLTVSNSFGCEHTSTEIFSVNPLPQIGFELSVSSGCIPLTVDFNNTSTGGVAYEWFFGTGATSTAENPQYTYTAHGLYDVSLIVETQDGCVDTLVVDHQVAAYPLPVAGFSHTPERTTVFAPTVDFTDLSSGASYWFWTFGDGYTSSEESPSHNYVNPGTFQIIQEVTNVYGCSRSAFGTVTVVDQFNVYVPNAFSPDADNVNDVFFPVIVGKGLIDKYELRVYDRWGVEVFFSEDMDAVWVGDFRGGEYYVQNDIYVWQIKYRLRGAEDSDVITGHVMQIR
jgi:PKD repeat protein